MKCKCGQEMKETGNKYNLSNNWYQKFECSGCKRTKVKVLDGFSKGGRIKVK